MLLKRIALLFLFVFASHVFATHDRAGEITYRALDTTNIPALQYEVTITTYTKGSSPADRCTLVIYFGDGDSAEVPRVNGPFNGQDDWGHTCNGEGLGVKVGADIKKSVYKAIHTYPGPGDYGISMFDPNRNGGIINIPNSVNTPFAVKSHLVISPFLGTNHSPQLLNPPIDEACMNKCFTHNAGAYDQDGDSLSYELIACFGEGGNPIPGFTLPNVNGGGSFTLNPITGDLVWCSPQLQGEYNAAFYINEWRKLGGGSYIRIGQVERDMQITVLANCTNDPPVLNIPADTCIIAGSKLEFKVVATDPNNDNITLSAIGGPLSPFVLTPIATFNVVNALGVDTGYFSWEPVCKHVRQQPYFVSFEAKDDNLNSGAGKPKVPLATFKTMQITVVGPPVQGLTAIPSGSSMLLSWQKSICGEVIGYKIYRKKSCDGWVPSPCDRGVPAISGYELVAATVGRDSTSYIDNNNGQGLIQGIDYSYIVVALYPDGAESFASTKVCAVLKRDVPAITHVDVLTTKKTNGKIQIKWLKPIANAINLDTTQIGNRGPYELRLLRAPGFLPQSGFVQLASASTPYFGTINFLSYVDSVVNTSDSAYTYRVDFYCENIFKGSSQNASSVYLKTTPSDNKLTLSWSEYVPWLNYKYYIFRETPPASGMFVLIDSTLTQQYVDSGLVNGTSYCYKVEAAGKYSDTTILHPLLNNSEIACGSPQDRTAPCPPVLQVSFDCENTLNSLVWSNPNNFCSDDVVQYKVYFKPRKDTLYKEVLTQSTPGDTSATHAFLFGAHKTIVGCYVVTALDSFGNESVSSNEICIDTCQIYELPNVFTPDGNGRNDFFIPVQLKYIKTINLKIYNRWGIVVFETSDPDIKWDGKENQSGKYCSDGTYFYTCIVTYQSVEKVKQKELKGFLQLIRSPNSIQN